MDTSMAMTRLEAAVEQQILIAGGDPDVEAAAAAILGALGSAVRASAQELAEQAAVEVAAQLPGHEIDVVLASGEPVLRVRPAESEAPAPGESLDARITLRLPPNLKQLIEAEADQLGESVNAWLVKSLSASTRARGRRGSRRITGTIET